MSKIKTADLTGKALAWAVAEAAQEEIGIEDGDVVLYFADSDGGNVSYRPWDNWAQGGPIIEREIDQISRVDTYPDYAANRFACDDWGNCEAVGPTPLIAAMRCYVSSKLGDEVEVPDELC